MGDLGDETLSEASRFYIGRRRRCRRLVLGLVASVVAIPLVLAVGERLHFGAAGMKILLALLVTACFACWLGMALTWMSIQYFPCPRCGKLFVRGSWGNWPGRRCKHCRLDLGQFAKPAANPLADGEL
jgi:hypothetical protein